jgi:hypothetical protein
LEANIALKIDKKILYITKFQKGKFYLDDLSKSKFQDVKIQKKC